jgi:GntR family transcriptional regulator, transcriptional repressor for pyruvate dehydrogenase complex
VIEPVVTTAAYELVAESIQRAIYLGQYMPGDRLPSERLLAQQLRVSRTTLREAIRILEARGYVKSHRGSAGGLIVHIPQEPLELLKHRLREYLASFEELLEFRLTIECAASRLAAIRRTGDDLTKLERAIDDMRASTSLPQFRRADNAFHLAIADATRNSRFRQAIEDARLAMLIPFDVLLDTEVLRLAQGNEHSQILAAIQSANPQEAEEAMASHLDRTRHELHLILEIEESQT